MSAYKTYIITAAVAGANPSVGFITCLKAYAKRLKAELIVAHIRGTKKDDELDPSITDNFKVLECDRLLGDNLKILDFYMRPNTMNPLAAMDRFVQNEQSAIIPHTKQFYRPVADMTGETRAIFSTGVCTEPNYPRTTAGRKGEEDHVIGAVIAECGKDGFFHARQIKWMGTGFTDMGTRVEPFGKGGVRFPSVRALAMVCGDWHTGDTDPVSRAATFSMFNEFEPRTIILHDIFNGHSVNHHEADKAINQVRAGEQGRLGLAKEVREVAIELGEICRHAPKDAKVLVAKANHDDWVAQYLNKGQFMQSDRNARYCLRLAEAMLDGKDPLEVGIRDVAKLPRVRFLKRKEKTRVMGIEIGQHGDAGVNGSKAGIMGLEKLQSNAIIGHAHSPQVYRNLIVVGTNTKLDLDYNQKSPSTWLHANALVWPDGSAQLLVMLEQRACRWSYSS